MQHDYTPKEILHAWNHRKYLSGQTQTEANLIAFLDALPMKSAEPERPQSAEIASFKAALAESEKQFQDKVYEIACLLDERDKAQGILKDCLAVMPFGNIKTHTVENLPGRIADLASEIAAVSSENERLEAELAFLRQSTQSAQPILADDGRSLGQVAFDAGNIVQKIKFPDQEIETWGESSEVHDMLEAASQAVSAVVEARMIRRMEAVPVEELEKVYWDGNEAVACYTALKRVRARLIAAAKGEGQAVVVNEPPQDDKQPDLSGEGEKQDPYARLKAYAKAGARICTHDTEWTNDVDWSWCLRPEHYEVHPDDLHMCPEYAPQAEAQPTTSIGWTPAVGDVVRLKSGGPIMTVHHISKDGSIACTHNANGAFEFATLPAACLTPAQNP